MSSNVMDPQEQAPPPATNAKQQVIERLKEASNVLVTVSNNPSVDQLAACIGFTLIMNKLGKHGTAVFSGAVPSTIQFLQPEKTIEKNTDSLRDFIIALDKAKADKLRYKVEDKYVKIFITPYRTSISDKDLEFSQGDFNVDVVVALGVHKREELDQAITVHGRILHDATVISVNTRGGTDVGIINWREENASSLSEMLVGIGEALKPDVLDSQMATAFLTGIVAETERFSNDKTSPATMTVSARLMNAGANQQLIATKLEEPKPIPTSEVTFDKEKMDELAKEKSAQSKPDAETPKPNNDGSLKIVHNEYKPIPMPPVYMSQGEDEGHIDEIHIDDKGTLRKLEDEKRAAAATKDSNTLASHMVLQPPSMGGRLTANSEPEGLDPSTDPLSLPALQQPLLNRDAPLGNPATEELTSPNTLEEIEESVDSPHLDTARQAVDQAAAASDPQRLDPLKRLGATPVDLDVGQQDSNESHNVQDKNSDETPPSAPPPLVPPPMLPPLPPNDPSGLLNPIVPL